MPSLEQQIRNNFRMRKQLQNRADDLVETLFILELEMRRSRTLEKKWEAFEDFRNAVERIEALRRDYEELMHDAEPSILDELDRKVSRVVRSQPYRVLEWLCHYSDMHWYIGPEAIDPFLRLRPC